MLWKGRKRTLTHIHWFLRSHGNKNNRGVLKWWTSVENAIPAADLHQVRKFAFNSDRNHSDVDFSTDYRIDKTQHPYVERTTISWNRTVFQFAILKQKCRSPMSTMWKLNIRNNVNNLLKSSRSEMSNLWPMRYFGVARDRLSDHPTL